MQDAEMSFARRFGFSNRWMSGGIACVCLCWPVFFIPAWEGACCKPNMGWIMSVTECLVTLYTSVIE